MRIAVVLLIVIDPCLCLAQDQTNDKRRHARAAAETMVQASGPLRLETAMTNTPEAWRARPRILGTYSNYANRNTFITPFPSFYPYGYGYGYYGPFYGYGFYGYGGRGWGLVYGYSTW